MPVVKRKQPVSSDSESGSSSAFSVGSAESASVDISTALVGKRLKPSLNAENEDDDLAIFLQETIAKRSIKEGTQILKNAKGKGKMSKGEVGGGSFQNMGLHPSLLRSLTLQGYRIPTPIQRQAIPALIANPPRDLVGMARTGSGKSLAYMVPLVQRLGGRHSSVFGARALILLPTRELALQVMKVGKELARGFKNGGGDHVGDKEDVNDKKGSNLRWGLVVGGESLDEQFEMIATNPDVVIATPGRLLHLVVEMSLDLKSVQCVVFDEADRLFEMGFEVAIHEILQRLPSARQTMLFSATLPKSLLEFARAGLQDPKLVRLDSDSKISPDLQMAFFSVKQAEKDVCLLYLLRDVIRVPLAPFKVVREDQLTTKKGQVKRPDTLTAPHQTLIFAATKHHVEYLLNLLTAAGYAVSHIYGSLDQAARTYQMDQFRQGLTNILVVTDVAARGIDIPVLENVVNYDFPQGARVFVHRVGRTARAGRQGWAWSFVTSSELPFLLDLQLFLGKPLVNDVTSHRDHIYTETLVLGKFQREKIDEDMEYLRSLDVAYHSLPVLREVMKRGHVMYERSKGKASPQSYKRAKEMMKNPKWCSAESDFGIHPVLRRGPDSGDKRDIEKSRKALLQVVGSFTPTETIFEVGAKGGSETASLMKSRRKAIAKSHERALFTKRTVGDLANEQVVAEMESRVLSHPALEMANDDDLVVVFGPSEKKSYRDDEFYMSHYQKDAMTEKGYSLNDGVSTFARQTSKISFDLTNDEGKVERRSKGDLMWDKKHKKFIKGDGIGADNVKMVRTENGTRLPASYRSGRFDEWKSKSRINIPRIGEAENTSTVFKGHTNVGGQHFKHNKIVVPKPLDKLSHDYERKIRRQKKEAEGESEVKQSLFSSKGKKLGVRRSATGKSYGRVKTELKTAEQISKDRKIQDKRKAKNARPSRSTGKRGKSRR